MNSRIKKATSLAQAGEGGFQVISLAIVREMAAAEGLAVREFEAELLDNGLVPLRYLRNIGTLGMDGQAKLLRSSAAVLGCGGLGGWITELLARAGVGRLVLIDGDVFSESNLNRQALCTEANLGQNKAETAAARVRAINSAVEAVPNPVMMTEGNAEALLGKNSIVFDALDNFPSRLILHKASKSLGIPMVHGAIAGWMGQVCVSAPVVETLAAIWQGKVDKGFEKGFETSVGTPGFTPSTTASLQVALGIRMLLGKGNAEPELSCLNLEGPALDRILM